MDIVKSFEERATGNGMLNHFDEYSIGQIYVPTDVALSMNASAGFENAVTHEDEAAASLRSEYCPPNGGEQAGLSTSKVHLENTAHHLPHILH